MCKKISYGLIAAVFFLGVYLLLPCRVEAASTVTGGDSLETATEVQEGIEYTTTGMSGWFKIKTPENVDYIGVGMDQFTNITMYDSEKEQLNQGARFNTSFAHKMEFWKNMWPEGSVRYADLSPSYIPITENTYYYLYINTSKAENCNFYAICSTRYLRESAKIINLNQDYEKIHYVSGSHFDNYYKFIAPSTGYYKVISGASTGSVFWKVEYKDGSFVGTKQGVFHATKGMTYYIGVEAKEPATVTLHVSNVRVSDISLNASSLELEANYAYGMGEQFLLEPTVSPSTAVLQTVTFSSSDPSVATVSEEGWVTAQGAGTAVITVTADDGGGAEQTCTVFVRESMYNGEKGTVDGIKYKVTSYTSGGGKVAVCGISNKNATSCTIPATVVLNGYTYKVEGIDNNAFANCNKLKTVNGTSNLTYIGSKAFYKCTKLTTIGNKKNTITLSKVKTIGSSAFSGCKAIKTVNISSSALTSIGNSAFSGCTSMKSFTSKSSKLASIGKKAFEKDKKLATITLKTSKLTKDKIGSNAFKGIKSTCKFKVPSKSVSKYKKIFPSKGAGSKIKIKKG